MCNFCAVMHDTYLGLRTTVLQFNELPDCSYLRCRLLINQACQFVCGLGTADGDGDEGLGRRAQAGPTWRERILITSCFGFWKGCSSASWCPYPQRFRFSTSVLFTVSVSLEFLTPLMPHYFLPLASLANVGKSMGLTTYIATQPVFLKSFTRSENLADINAKSQVGACQPQGPCPARSPGLD